MKVTILVESFPQLSETFILRQACALNARVVSGVVDELLLSTISEVPEHVSISGGQLLRGGWWPQVYARVRRRLGFPVEPHWSRYIEQRWRQYLTAEKPDVVLAQYGPNALRALSGCRELNIPLVAHFHGFDASALMSERAYTGALVGLFGYASAVIGVSGHMCETLSQAGCPIDKVHHIVCGVPMADFPIVDQQGQQPCHFIMVGRLVPKKAPDLVVKAFEYCAQRDASVRLTIIGGGGLLQALKYQVDRSPVRDRITVMGPQSNKTVQRELSSAGCFVQHSVTGSNGDTEGWPVAIAEAAASGLPIISTLHAGIPEQVVEGETGFLVKEGDWQSMGERMVQIAQSVELRVNMGKRGREHMVKTGSFDDQVSKLEKLLSRVSNSS